MHVEQSLVQKPIKMTEPLRLSRFKFLPSKSVKSKLGTACRDDASGSGSEDAWMS